MTQPSGPSGPEKAGPASDSTLPEKEERASREDGSARHPAPSGDSPKPHGDPLKHVIEE